MIYVFKTSVETEQDIWKLKIGLDNLLQQATFTIIYH